MSVGCTNGCPAGVRPGTPPCFCVLFCKCLPRPSLGVQGALIAMLFDPLPLGRSWFVAHTSRNPDARCCSLRPKGKGCCPCTPTNLGRLIRLSAVTDRFGSSSLRRASWPPPRCRLCVFATIPRDGVFARRSTRTENRPKDRSHCQVTNRRAEEVGPIPSSGPFCTNDRTEQIPNTTGLQAGRSRLHRFAHSANEECPTLTAPDGQKRRLFNGLTGESIEAQRRFHPSIQKRETSRFRAKSPAAVDFAFSSHSPLSHDCTEIHGSADPKHPSRNRPQAGSSNPIGLATSLSTTAPCFEDKAEGLLSELLVRCDSLPVARRLGIRALVAMMPALRV